MSEQVKRVCANTLTGLIDLAHEQRHALISQGFPDNDEGDALSRVRDSRVARIDRIIEAARTAQTTNYDALHAEAEALRAALFGIASVSPAERGIEWAKSYASDGLKGAGSELYARWLDTFKEAEALRAENGRIQRELAIAQSDIKVEQRVSSNLRQHKNDYMEAAEETKRALESRLEAARGLLRDIFCTCNLRELPSEHAIRDISNQIESLLTATPAPEVPDHTERNLEMAEQGERKEPGPDVRGLVEALEHARLFIRNGVELGYVKMPDADTPDPAHDTLPKIETALAAHRQAQQGDSHDT